MVRQRSRYWPHMSAPAASGRQGRLVFTVAPASFAASPRSCPHGNCRHLLRLGAKDITGALGLEFIAHTVLDFCKCRRSRRFNFGDFKDHGALLRPRFPVGRPAVAKTASIKGPLGAISPGNASFRPTQVALHNLRAVSAGGLFHTFLGRLPTSVAVLLSRALTLSCLCLFKAGLLCSGGRFFLFSLVRYGNPMKTAPDR